MLERHDRYRGGVAHKLPPEACELELLSRLRLADQYGGRYA